MKNTLKKAKKEELSEEEKVQQRREKTAQQWIPIADIDGPMAIRKDDVLVKMIKITPENLDLYSEKEKRRKIEALAEGLNGETEGFKFFCIGRPVDLNNYLTWLQEKAKQESDFVRRNLLKGFMHQASQMASSGETMERRFYLILTKPNGNKALMELNSRVEEFKEKFADAELEAEICDDDEVMDVLDLFANPNQAGIEKTRISHDITTFLEY